MMDFDGYQKNPRDYALQLVESGAVSADHLLVCAIKHMSHDDLRDMLDANELSPRFAGSVSEIMEWQNESIRKRGVLPDEWLNE